MRLGSKERELAFKLLQENASLSQVRDFLKARNLNSSAGSWDVMIDVRLKPALEDRSLTPDDLLELIRLTEEHGAQHAFLYRCGRDKATSLMETDRVQQLLRSLDLEGLLQKPRLVDQPHTPTIVEVRWQGDEGERAFIIKIVEQRIYREFLKEEAEGNFVVRRYRVEKVRAVNLFKLHADGLLELRIQSHRNTSQYESDMQKLWAMVDPILPRKEFKELPITKAKQAFWEKRKELVGVVRHSGARFRNNRATILSAAAGAVTASLAEDESAAKSLDHFLQHDAYCDGSNIWFLPNNGNPSTEIHVLLSGRPNEFAVTVKCSKEDYEYALTQLRRRL